MGGGEVAQHPAQVGLGALFDLVADAQAGLVQAQQPGQVNRRGLRQLTDAAQKAKAQLYKPNEVIVWRSKHRRASSGARTFYGENPRNEAKIFYSLASATIVSDETAFWFLLAVLERFPIELTDPLNTAEIISLHVNTGKNRCFTFFLAFGLIW